MALGNVECIKFAASQKMDVDKFTCSGLHFSGINQETIKEKLASKDAGFFSEEYLTFLSNPEEAGACYTQSGASVYGDLDMSMIKQVNKLMNDLPESVKSLMITKLDNYMLSSFQNLDTTLSGFYLFEKERKLKTTSIQDEIKNELSAGFKSRQRIVARYIAILIAHEIIWESSFLTEIINFFNFFKGLLRVVRGQEQLVVDIH